MIKGLATGLGAVLVGGLIVLAMWAALAVLAMAGGLMRLHKRIKG